MSQDNSDTTLLSLHVTQEQRDTIEALFNHNNWNFTEANDTVPGRNTNDDNDYDLVQPLCCVDQDEDADKCPQCLCKPCITDNRFRQLWWPVDCQPARRRNHGIRKGLYRKFWTMLYHRGIWADEEYLQRKIIAFGLDP